MLPSIAASVTAQPPLSRRLVLIMAIACGVAVSAMYVAQPLLATIGETLDVSAGTAGLLVTATQIGYAAGLLLIVPLGDLVDRRRLICPMMLGTAVALVVAAAAPTVAVLGLALTVVGVTAVVAQILLPLAGHLARDEERGRVVGHVMSGLLLGILLGRTGAGLLAELGGWRLVYGVCAGLMVILAALLWRTLPTVAQVTDLRYGPLLRSIGTLVRTEPRLQRRMAYGALSMASFALLWTALAFLLSAAPYHYGEGTIGLFGLAGVVGAAAAQGAGRLVDRGLGQPAMGTMLACIAASWPVLGLADTSLAALVVGIIVLDLGIQGQHILNQSALFAMAPDARSRITTAYTTMNFVWAALGSAAASVAWTAGGWTAVSGVGTGLAVVALLVWVDDRIRARARRRAGGPATLSRSTEA